MSNTAYDTNNSAARRPVKSCLLITKADYPLANALGNEILACVQQRGIDARMVENPEGRPDFEKAYSSAMDDLGGGPDLILVLGGDGTMLSVARRLHKTDTPLLGVNLGKVGFLTELSPDDWRPRLEGLLESGVAPCDRMALEFLVLRDGNPAPVASGRVINDLVVARGSLARLIPLDVVVDGESIGVFRADGIIVSTPTGATGYAVSASGPLLHPSLRAFGLTAVSPFLHGFTPMVLPEGAELSVTVLQGSCEAYLTLDGQEGFALSPGDRVEIRAAKRGFCIVRLDDSSYFDKLRDKGFIKGHDLTLKADA